MMNDDKLIDSFDKSLCMDNLADVCSNIGDACIDLIAKNEVIDAIPVLGLLKGVYIMYKDVATARLIKKLGRLLYRTSDIGAESAFCVRLCCALQGRRKSPLWYIGPTNKVQRRMLCTR